MNYRDAFLKFEPMKAFHSNKSTRNLSDFVPDSTNSPKISNKPNMGFFQTAESVKSRDSLIPQKSQETFKPYKYSTPTRNSNYSSTIQKNKPGLEDLLVENKDLKQKAENLLGRKEG